MTEMVIVSPVAATPVIISGTGIGPQGPTGPQGPVGGQYVHTQNTPSNSWTINHNLGMKPHYVILDSTGNQVEGTGVWENDNTLVVTFSGSFSGTAYLS